MVEFGELRPDGTVRHVRTISQAAIAQCPFTIFSASHYRSNDTCRCDDHTHAEMAAWGYRWSQDNGRWEA